MLIMAQAIRILEILATGCFRSQYFYNIRIIILKKFTNDL